METDSVLSLVQGSTPLRDHHVATDSAGAQTLVCYGVPVARVSPSGLITLPPLWETTRRAVSVRRAQFLGMTKQELRAAVKYDSARVLVAPLYLPVSWLARYGPDAEEPYTR